MKKAIILLLTCTLAACGGGGSSATPPAPAAPAHTASTGGTVATNWVFRFPAAAAPSAARRAQFVTANIQSVTIALNSVTPGGIPNGLTTSVTTNISAGSCATGCNVPGPAVPPGSDGFTITTYDATGGGGSVISTASPTYTITPGQSNTNTVTLNGVPASFTVNVPSGTAGTAFGATAFSVTALDADGETIVGSYQNPVTLATSDTSGATAITTSGPDSPPGGTLISSSDAAQLAYTGLAIVPATISAHATNASGSASFAPALSPIVYAGPLRGATPEIDLYATSGTGSSATFTASETGWTNAPYNRNITATEAGGCAAIATTSPSAGTAFTTTVAASPAAGSCALTLSDFSGGNTASVTLTYTTSGIGVN